MVFLRLSLVLAALWLPGVCDATAPYMDVKSDYEKLLDAYETNSVKLQEITPKASHSAPIKVSLGMDIFAVMDFDAVNGQITLIGAMTAEWQDDIVAISGQTFTGSLQTIQVDYNKIWNPNLILMNDAKTVEKIGDIAYRVRYNLSSGHCHWKPRLIINAACASDMTYYPFDEQKCPLTITPWFRDSTKVDLSTLSDSWNTDDMDESGIWSVSETSSKAYVTDGQSYVDFTIVIKRKPLFLSLVIVLPVLLLSLLTGFMFLLPAGSGERAGFGITCFLSFVVILQLLMQFLPQSSVPMSVLCYYIITMLVFSAGLSIVNMLILRMYLSPSSDKIPAWLLMLVKIARCIPCRLCYRRCKCREKLKLCCRRCCDRVVFPCCRYCKKTVCQCWEKYNVCQCCCHKKNPRKFDIVVNKKFNISTIYPELTRSNVSSRDGGEISDKIENDIIISDGLKLRSVKKVGSPRVYPAFPGNKLYNLSDVNISVGNLSDIKADGNLPDVNVSAGTLGSTHTSRSSGYSSKSNSFLQTEEFQRVGSSKGFIPSQLLNDKEVSDEIVNLKDEETVPDVEVITDDEEEVDDVENTPAFLAKLTWELIAKILDAFFIVVFISVQTVFTLFFLIPLGARY